MLLVTVTGSALVPAPALITNKGAPGVKAMTPLASTLTVIEGPAIESVAPPMAILPKSALVTTLVLRIIPEGRFKAPVLVNVFCPRLKVAADVAPTIVALPLRLTCNNGFERFPTAPFNWLALLSTSVPVGTPGFVVVIAPLNVTPA
ncbi:MAG TPA: hypothetical protein VLG76_05990 [Rhabdochlamydiaceae bacterium]|nr:hypothetical protein [Rhabdochlamydiaceae bacterium]